MTIAQALAAYALNRPPLSDAVQAEVKRHIVDSLACAFGAYPAEPARIAAALAPSVTDGGATIWLTGTLTTPEAAAFANGILVRYLDFNDTYLSKEPAHPSDNIPALLALAQSVGATGEQALQAIALAYEIQCGLCDAFSIRKRGWDHVTYGAFSVALAAGQLLKLTETQLVHALGLALTPNAAMRQTRVGELSHWKGCAFANTARNAVFAARLAQAGMTGPSEIVEGEMGFFAQVCGGPFELPAFSPNTDAILRTYIKHYPAEYHSQSAIEAILDLSDAIGDWRQVKAIDIDSFDAAVDIIAGFPEHWQPKSRETADHSMPYCVARALLDGDITLDSFAPDKLADPNLLSLIQTVKVHRHPEMTAGYPDGIPNRLRVTLADGRVLEQQVTYPLGHAKHPMTDADVADKFVRLAGPVLGDDAAQAFLKVLAHIERVDNWSGLWMRMNGTVKGFT
jgi:2-methylcitrate dehydratase